MKNTIYFLIFSLLLTSSAYCHQEYCSENNEYTYFPQESCKMDYSFGYFTVGAGPIVFIPNVGIGYRQRYTKFGWDTALSYSTIGYAHQLTGHMVGHYYLSPYKQNSCYLGFGLLGSAVFTNHKGCGGTLSPDFVFGKELETCNNSHHFIEMHVGMPTYWFHSKCHLSTYLPLMYVKYGMSF